MAAKAAREHAYAPYSGFSVGAVLTDTEGQNFAGCNVENASYGATICAERNAVTHAVAEGGSGEYTGLIVVSESQPPAPPCALCLQVLAEFCRPEMKVYLADMTGVKQTYRLEELLPHPFSRNSLTEHAQRKK